MRQPSPASIPAARSQRRTNAKAGVNTRSASTLSHWFAAVRSYVPGSSSVDQKQAKIAFREARIGTARKAEREKQRVAARQRKAAAQHDYQNKQVKKAAPVSRSHYSRKIEHASRPKAVQRAVVPASGPASPRYNPRGISGVSAAHKRAAKRDAVPALPAPVTTFNTAVTPVVAPALTWKLVPIEDDLSELDQDNADQSTGSESDEEDWSWKADGAAAEGDDAHGDNEGEDGSANHLKRRSNSEFIVFDERSPVKRMEVRMRSRQNPLLG